MQKIRTYKCFVNDDMDCKIAFSFGHMTMIGYKFNGPQRASEFSFMRTALRWALYCIAHHDVLVQIDANIH